MPDFERLGVRMVAISPDQVAEAGHMKRKLGLSMTILSDESLQVVDLYNLRHEGGIAGAPKRKILRPLAIPTTFLTDGNGVVRWVDQANDYRVRSEATRVLTAVRAALPTDTEA